MTYKEQIKSPKWQRKRLLIMQRDDFKCQSCGDEETTLNVHHLKYKNNCHIADYDDNDLITLCTHCHVVAETLKTESKDLNFKDVKIYKTKFNDGFTMSFVSFDGSFAIISFDKNDNPINGFKFYIEKYSEILKILNHTKKIHNGKKIH